MPRSHLLDATVLVRRCLAGEAAAWEELVDRYGRLVYSVPMRYGLSTADADDVFQAVFVAAFRHMARLKDPEKLSAWLITSAHRESWRVSRARGATIEFPDAVADPEAPPAEAAERWERQDRVNRALSALGGRCEELLRALYFRRSETSYEAIARELGMPVGSIGPTRARCLRKLERLMEAAVDVSESGAPAQLP